MKKLKYLLILVLALIIPFSVKADGGGPMFDEYEVKISNKNGAKVYEYNSIKNDYNETSKVMKYDEVLTVYDEDDNYVCAGRNEIDGTDDFKRTCVKIVDTTIIFEDKTYNFNEKKEYYTLAETKVYEKPVLHSNVVGTIKKGEKIELATARLRRNDEDYYFDAFFTWKYYSDNGIKGWVLADDDYEDFSYPGYDVDSTLAVCNTPAIKTFVVDTTTSIYSDPNGQNKIDYKFKNEEVVYFDMSYKNEPNNYSLYYHVYNNDVEGWVLDYNIVFLSEDSGKEHYIFPEEDSITAYRNYNDAYDEKNGVNLSISPEQLAILKYEHSSYCCLNINGTNYWFHYNDITYRLKKSDLGTINEDMDYYSDFKLEDKKGTLKAGKYEMYRISTSNGHSDIFNNWTFDEKYYVIGYGYVSSNEKKFNDEYTKEEYEYKFYTLNFASDIKVYYDEECTNLIYEIKSNNKVEYNVAYIDKVTKDGKEYKLYHLKDKKSENVGYILLRDDITSQIYYKKSDISRADEYELQLLYYIVGAVLISVVSLVLILLIKKTNKNKEAGIEEAIIAKENKAKKIEEEPAKEEKEEIISEITEVKEEKSKKENNKKKTTTKKD